MQTVNETYLYERGGWIVRIRPPAQPDPARLLLLLHGLTGDEQVMWVFAQGIPQNTWILAPRAIYPAEDGGFSWLPAGLGLKATVQDFQPAVERLLEFIGAWAADTGVEVSRYGLMGFSQGAALAFSIGLLEPGVVERIAGLSGFVPQGAEPYVQHRPLEGKPVYVAHGSRDDTVPVEMARGSVRLLEQAGAQVTYCEEDVGHKLSRTCFSALRSFFSTG